MRLIGTRKRAGKNPCHREAHPEQVRLPAGPAGGGQDRSDTGRVAVRGLGEGEALETHHSVGLDPRHWEIVVGSPSRK